MDFTAPVPLAAGPFCLEACPEEDLVVLVAQSSDASRGKGAPEWLKRVFQSSSFLSLSRTADGRLSVIVGESFLKEVTLPSDVEVERNWAALRLDKAKLDPSVALHSFSSLCRVVQEAGVALHAVSTPDSEHLLLQTQQLPLLVAALLNAGHAVAPATRIYAAPTSSLVRKHDHCKAFAGAWGLARREAPLGVLAEEHSHAKGPIRIIATCGLFVDVGFSDAANGMRASCGYFEEMNSGRVRRQKFVDYQPPLGLVPELELTIDGAFLNESSLLGCSSYKETWHRLEAARGVVALELVSEFPSKSAKRNGCWVFCGSFFVRVVGLSRGQGIVAGTCCRSLGQLQKVKDSEAIRSEIDGHYEALCGTLEKPGVLRLTRTASIETGGSLFYSADEGVGGTITLPTKKATEVVHVLPDGTEQKWRVLQWDLNPFSERSLSPPASESSASFSSGVKTKKNKKKERARSSSNSRSGSDSVGRKKKKKKDKDKVKKKKKKARSSDDAERSSASSGEVQKKKKKDKEKKRSTSRSIDKNKKKKKEKDDGSRSGPKPGKKKKKEKKERSRSRTRSRSGKKKKRDGSSSLSRSPKQRDTDTKKGENDGSSFLVRPADTTNVSDAEPRKTPITFNFAPKSATQRDESGRVVAQKMLQKSEAHASHVAAVGELFKKAGQAKPQEDAEPFLPAELLPATPGNAERGTLAETLAQDQLGGKPQFGTVPETNASPELQVVVREDPSKQDAVDTAKTELPANFQFPKGYPPPKEETDVHEFPVNFQFPKGYPPPPEESAATTVHPLFPRGYPPPPEIDPQAAALLQAGVTLPVPPPPPPDLSATQLLLSHGMLFAPQPSDLTAGAYALPPPPGPPPTSPLAADSVHDFIAENKIDTRAAGALRALPLELQQKVVAEGPVVGTNPSAVITARIRKFQAQAETQTKNVGSLKSGTIGPQPPPTTAAAVPGAIGPQPPLGVAVGVPGPPPGPPPGAPPPPAGPAAHLQDVAAQLQAAQLAAHLQAAQLTALQPGLLASLSGLGAGLPMHPALQAAAGSLFQTPPGLPPAP